VIEELIAAAEPGLVAIPSGRYFGFVIGGAVPASLAADWLTSAWDQNAGLYVGGPSAAVVEEAAGARLADLLSEVNTGSFDPLAEIVPAARDAGAWVHVDGAFGLWAAASPRQSHLTAGAERADSWSVDAHKWLTVPYDCGVAFCRHPEAHRAAISASAEYLIHDERGLRDQVDWTPEFSRRARDFATYAALRALGRRGVTELIERSCEHARRFAEGLHGLTGAEVLNAVVLNQVLSRQESDERTDDVLRRVQESGEAWMSGTLWDGRSAIRVSVSNWQTSDTDVERTLDAFVYATQAPAR
jgi:glutamate/tyrosine decarboxylase-like PLP-dependent enzyme